MRNPQDSASCFKFLLCPGATIFAGLTGSLQTMNRLPLAILIAATLAGVTVFFLLQGQQTVPAAGVPQSCVLLSFGWRDPQPEMWQGRVEVTGGRLARLEGWRLGPEDNINSDG